ncbi:Gfo/Idh/MocA family protein [Paenibacillus alginolyticus]|uniref:Gfo/Idh/MocA family oxidoreductase n=1 Tax=Paenibacillus alginolyticus TaxID=59839 RepID=A0ABT4GPX4_9BACL|nr:Gfo/Idh/MocA family oxidoreductase [Paenibacillus alginolyticus]MCY9698170.1 Gfo/Idh/MocA family oxidoreductase [Paenibacillus alginolyticus]MEC0146716.1 Gfo/Idh/MocA family oxidoreductase [Paenibacillus alginolyticus]
MKKLKAAIIGAGFIGEAHIEAIRRLGYVEVAAIAQTSFEKASKRAKELCIPRATGDYREILQDDEIDVIHNCTPNHLHYQINKEVLQHGKHLLSEKPLTLTSQEARELSHLANENNLTAGINFNYRQFPMVQHMRGMVQNNEFGAIRIVRGEYLQDWLMYDTDYNWRLEPVFAGRTRAIGDIGSHLLDLAQYVTGRRIVEVFADMATIIPTRMKADSAQALVTFHQNEYANMVSTDIHTEDYSSILVKFDDDSRGVFTVSQVSPGHKNRLELNLDGSLAAGSWRQEEPCQLWVGHRGRPDEVVRRDPELVKPAALPFVHYPGGHEEGWVDSVKNMMKHFYEAVQQGSHTCSDSVASFEEGYRIMLIIDAIVQSVETGSWVKVQQA